MRDGNNGFTLEDILEEERKKREAKEAGAQATAQEEYPEDGYQEEEYSGDEPQAFTDYEPEPEPEQEYQPEPEYVPEDPGPEYVIEEPEPEPFKLSQTIASLDPGGSATLFVTGAMGEVSWATSNNKVVTVADGVVTAVAGGSATVTATSGEDSAVCIFTVSGVPYVSTLNLYLNKTDFTFVSGSAPVQMRLKLKETRADYDGEIVWASADPQIAKISETGLVEWVGKGTTTVTATVDGLVFECIVRAK